MAENHRTSEKVTEKQSEFENSYQRQKKSCRSIEMLQLNKRSSRRVEFILGVVLLLSCLVYSCHSAPAPAEAEAERDPAVYSSAEDESDSNESPEEGARQGRFLKELLLPSASYGSHYYPGSYYYG